MRKRGREREIVVCLIIPWRGEREIVVCFIIPWRMGIYTDR